MEQRIKERFSKSILDQIRTAKGVKPEDIRELGGFESYMISGGVKRNEY